MGMFEVAFCDLKIATYSISMGYRQTYSRAVAEFGPLTETNIQHVASSIRMSLTEIDATTESTSAIRNASQ